MRIDVWSDIACPWCWLGKHHLQQALQGAGIEAEIDFRSYELQPDAQATRPARKVLEERYGDPAGLAAIQQRLADMGRLVGITYDFENQLMANTFDAHRLHHLAKTHDLGGPLMERFMQACHGEGADLSDHATLRRLAGEVGLDAAEVDQVLEGDRFAEEVRRDEAVAAQNGIRGVPFFVFDGRLALGGAQPVEVFEGVLREAQAAPSG